MRLATKAGHAVRVVQTPDAQRFVGAASFAALTGAPVLTDEFERDPARGAFPDQAPPEHDPLSHLELVRNADAFLIAPATANTIAKLAARAGRQPADQRRARRDRARCSSRPAMNDHMWEHPATQANVATLRARGTTVVDPGVGALGSRHEWGAGRLAEPAELLAAVEALVPAGQPARGTACACWSPPAARASRSTRCATSATAPRAAWASRSPTRPPRSAPTSPSSRPTSRCRATRACATSTSRPPPSCRTACGAAFADCDVLVMAAAVADFRPAAAAGGQAQEGRPRRA